jgi:hypothetical protein
LASAIQSVEGARLLTAPKPGSGANAESIAVVELSGKATLSAVTAAVENAKTPHREHSPPGVDAVVAGKLKPSATPEAITAALKKADLVEE